MRTLTIRTQLILSFGLVLALLSGISFVGYNGLNESANGFSEYRELARDTHLSGMIQVNMLMMRFKVKDFIISE